MPKPILLLTRKLPDAIEARAARDYDARLNSSDDPWSRDGAEIARRAAECGAAGILCAAGDPMGAATIEALPPSVKIIATFSVGTDHLSIPAAAARGITVANTPGVLSFATAECAFTLMLMAARRAGEGERLVRARAWTGWAPTQLMGVTLEGKKLGIAGYGRIGQELAAMARGMRMEIHYHNRNRVAPELEQGAIFHADAKDFLGAIDVLSMHIPGGEATRKWLNAERLSWMKPGSIVVNTGRGGTVDDAALVTALSSGHIRAAGLDVYDGEPAIHEGYFALENIALLPHLGSATEETRNAMGHRALDNLDAVLLRGTVAPDALP
ncbi:2-hydroxyacid dehydrogenase [Falsiroseomonas stagni]|uniref:D-isomer specific 2-hydroxyacid dehydrogenase, catalytic domain n=1 Tax=Falsiroseomonas stagni DSM 19981 TaxID=1123062 RepID=A0A1I3Z6I2_9PROT|nr:D-glycerate dehydrogenase [Falsiroseomonas stagni]SFK39301.1 D-isomer specific 2-hydroxyacid dehydrogenase, catalytic domain [Falsiroseomonas stagni DSM 19981]